MASPCGNMSCARWRGRRPSRVSSATPPVCARRWSRYHCPCPAPGQGIPRRRGPQRRVSGGAYLRLVRPGGARRDHRHHPLQQAGQHLQPGYPQPDSLSRGGAHRRRPAAGGQEQLLLGQGVQGARFHCQRRRGPGGAGGRRTELYGFHFARCTALFPRSRDRDGCQDSARYPLERLPLAHREQQEALFTQVMPTTTTSPPGARSSNASKPTRGSTLCR